MAKFLDGKIGADERTLLDDLRKTQADAPESWGRFPVILRGEASKYDCERPQGLSFEIFIGIHFNDMNLFPI